MNHKLSAKEMNIYFKCASFLIPLKKKTLFGSVRSLLQHAASSLLSMGFSLVVPGLSSCSTWT